MPLYKFNLHAIAPLILSIFIFSLGIFVYFKNKRAEINKVFALFCLCYAIIMFGTFMMFISTEDVLIISWDRFIYIGGAIIPAVWYHLIASFTKAKSRDRLIKLNYFLSTIFLLSSRTKYFVDELYRYGWGYHTRAKLFHHIFLIYYGATFIKGLYDLYITRKQSNPAIKQNQLKYLSISVFIASLTSIGLLSAYNVSIYPLFYQIFGILFVIIVAYAILKHRLMDISITITRTGIFIAVYTFVLGLPFVLVAVSKDWLMKVFGANWWLGPLALMVVLATVGPFLYIYLQKKAEAILLREQRRYQETLKQVGMEMTRIHSVDKLLDFIVKIITENVRISHTAIYLSEANNGKLLLKAGHNLKKEQPASIERKNSLINWLENQKETLIYEEVKRKSEEKPDPIFKNLEEQMHLLNATVVVPNFLEDKLLGVLILGDKQSGKIYTSEDLYAFSVLATQSALAIENALLYENIEEQVKQRTEQLVEVQKQLIQAEKLATVGTLAGGVAHEINNPLTAVLTNVQMLLVDAAKLDSDSKESLELIEEATKRCRSIVQKLMVYAKKPLEASEVSQVDLLKVAQNVISFLSYQLEQENIKIITEAKKDAYFVVGNPNELEQVFTNIILNAKDAVKKLKNSGNIYIAFSEDQEQINIKIKDEGIGISKELMPKIFDPFFTTKEIGKGLGLGLSICQSIVEKHHGKITVQSEPNKGSIFTVQLPKK